LRDAEVVKLLTTRFVPVAVDQHIHRVRKDPEGELFGQVLKQAGRGLDGYAQGVYLFTPEGKLLAFANTADAGRVKRLLETALKQFDPGTPAPKFAEVKSQVLPPLPKGGLVLDVTAKLLGGYAAHDKQGQRYLQSLGRDHLWLRADEVAALVKGVLPESVKRRLVRYHLVDNTRGEPPMWRDTDIKKLELTLREGRLTGSVQIETAAGDRGYHAHLLGFLETKDGKVTRFDVLAHGHFWGEGNFTRGAPRGRFPLAVSFALPDPERGTSKIPPQGARGNLQAYLR
jgi:hypothetical protein